MPLRTDDEDTMPMYTPKINELVPPRSPEGEPASPQLDPKNIAPDGVATPRTTTVPLPPSWVRVLAALALLLGACAADPDPSGDHWDLVVACYDYCAASEDACGDRPACYDSCGYSATNAPDGCEPPLEAWYDCMAEPSTVVNCGGSLPIAKVCEEHLREYAACSAGGGS